MECICIIKVRNYLIVVYFYHYYSNLKNQLLLISMVIRLQNILDNVLMMLKNMDIYLDNILTLIGINVQLG